jgi:hypothetical protein
MTVVVSIIKPTTCTIFSNLFLEWNSTCFGQFLCLLSGVLHCTHSKPVQHIPFLCVQCKTSGDGHRNCPKHVEFYSKNKFEKIVHLVGFIVQIYHDARSHERQTIVVLISSLFVHNDICDRSVLYSATPVGVLTNNAALLPGAFAD